MNFLKRTKLAFIQYAVCNTKDTGHYIITLRGVFITNSQLKRSISKACNYLVEHKNAVITEIKIIK